MYGYRYIWYIYQHLGSLGGTLPETNITFENMPKPKMEGSSSNHQFLGAFAVSFREGKYG